MLISLSLVACTDLDDKLYSDIPATMYPENETQAQLVTLTPYSQLRSHLDGGWWFAQEITSDLIVAPTRGNDWDDGGKWRVLHTHGWDNNTEAVNSMWGNFYAGVTECNKAIEYLGDSETSKNAVAQMKVLRAYFYYLLIDNYGDVPYITSFETAEKSPSKTSRSEIYNNIVADVKSALPHLKGTSKSSVNKYTGFSLLAKLALNAEQYTGTPQWQECENYCDSVIAGPYSLEANRLSPFIAENDASTENIFTIPYDEDNYHGFLLHRRSLHYVSTATYEANTTFWNGFCTQERLCNYFENDDQRLKGILLGQQFSSAGQALKDNDADNADVIFTKEVPALKMDNSFSKTQIRMSGGRIVKFQIQKGAKDNMNNDFPVFRLADFILMKAECQLRKSGGTVSKAKELINSIRTAAGASTWGDADITLDKLLEERAREMWCEAHRRQDLIRFGKFKDSWWEKAADTESNYTFPIPQWAIDANSNLAD